MSQKRDPIRRTAEAAALRFILTNRMKGNNTAVVAISTTGN